MGFFTKGPDGKYDDAELAQDIILNSKPKVDGVIHQVDLQSYIVLLTHVGTALMRDRKKIQQRMDRDFPGEREKINKERTKKGLAPI